jgi:trehalose synthase-fused probable maltokinase
MAQVQISRQSLLDKLPDFLKQQRWFGGKARGLRSLDILDSVPMGDERVTADLVLVEVHYADQYPDETYALPLLPGDDLRDALGEPAFLTLLLRSIEHGRLFKGERGELFASPSSAYRSPGASGDLQAKLLASEQSNSSVIFEDRYILKLLRQAGEGLNPELEVGTFLTERARFQHVPALTGSILYRGHNGGQRTLGILQSFVANQGNAWEYTLQELAAYFAQAAQNGTQTGSTAPSSVRSNGAGPAEAELGSYPQAADLLGCRTAELHLALASDPNDPEFSPESFSEPYRALFRRSAAEQCQRVFETLDRQAGGLPPNAVASARQLHDLRPAIEDRLRSFGTGADGGARIRIHGDYHLGQVLRAGGDFVIIDFEGEPARQLAERRAKQSPLQDVAGMLRSFHYAAVKGMRDWFSVSGTETDGASDAVAGADWQSRASFWRDSVSRRFLTAYLATAQSGRFLPGSAEGVRKLLDSYLLSKAVYELGYELNNRPDWVIIPLSGILDIMVS